jgi:hypothetical protein
MEACSIISRYLVEQTNFPVPCQGAFGVDFPLLDLFRAALGYFLHPLAKRLAPRAPYLLGCRVFFALA